MCGITFRQIKTIENMLNTQADRGLDSIGMLIMRKSKPLVVRVMHKKDYINWEQQNGDEEVGYWKFKSGAKYTFFTLATMYQDIMEEILKDDNKGNFVFAHHRKGSVGSGTIDNAHPYETNKFILAQNGTDKSIHEWGLVEGIDKERSDSYVLLYYLDKHCTTLQECIERLKLLVERNITLGVVTVYSKEEKKLLFFSDGKRSLYIEKVANQEKVEYIQSRKDGTKEDYGTKGYIIVDFSGNIISSDLQDVNIKKVKKTTAFQVWDGQYRNQYANDTTFYRPPLGGQTYLPAPKSKKKDAQMEETEIIFDTKRYDEPTENDWINYLDLDSIIEIIDSEDEKIFHDMQMKIFAGLATDEQEEAHLLNAIQIEDMIKRAEWLIDQQIKTEKNTSSGLSDFYNRDKREKEKKKKIEELDIKKIQLKSYREIFKI